MLKEQKSEKSLIELRYEDGEIIIAASEQGLIKIKEFCDKLISNLK